MDFLQAAALGVVQGLTEFLPISSTAHLALFPWFLGWKDPGLTFDVALHVGTLLAIILYFRQDLTQMALSWFQSFTRPNKEDPYQRLSWLVVVGSIPAVIAGITFEKQVETVLRSPYVIATMLIVVAVLFAIAERVTKQTRTLKEMTWRSALLVGVAQACALIPGTSRSGSTMMMAMFAGFKREEAARFSFLLGAPIMVGGIVFKMKDLLGDPIWAAQWPLIAVGVAASAISGYLCIRFLLAFLKTQSMTVFIVYRIALGLIIFGLLLTGVLPDTAVTH